MNNNQQPDPPKPVRLTGVEKREIEFTSMTYRELRGGDAAPPDGPLPATIITRGAPTRYQMRLALRPVSREWDESWQPLDVPPKPPAGEAG